jgi:lysophospholipase L1-like esterase
MKFMPPFPELLQDYAERSLHAVGRRRFLQTVVAAFIGAAVGLPVAPAARAEDPIDLRAVATWSAPMVSALPSATNQINNQTLRQIAHVSIGGDQARVKFSNRYGTVPLVIGAAQIALRDAGENIVAGSSRTLTFSGNPTFTVPAGAELFSDWVSLTIPALSDVAVDLYLPGDTGTVNTGSPLTVFNGAMQTNYVSQPGNNVGSMAFPVASTRLAWSFMSAINTRAAMPTGAIVAFGDSITQGLRSTNNTNRRWPDVLARRIIEANADNERGVANVGISGNRVWVGGTTTNPSAMARLDRDALVQTGATHIIVLLGINDISGGATADQVITALRQMIVRAHSRGLRIFGATLTPFGNAPDAREATRLAVNAWIRSTDEYDGVVDFDAAIRDPANPRRMLPIFDSGDSLHPSDAGYEAMGNAVDLSLFGIVRSIPRALLPPIELRMVPNVLNLRTTGGVVTAVLSVPDGYDLREWGVADVQAEGAPAISTAFSGDGKTLIAMFNKRDLADIATGEAVTFTVTGTFNQAGAQGPLVGSTTVRVLR